MKKNIIEYITRNKGLTQKEIATQLGVSGTQITKWKQGEKIPYDQNKKLISIAGLITDDFEWATLINNDESNADAWYEYVQKTYTEELVFGSRDWDDHGELQIFTQSLLKDLKNLGADIPPHPNELKKKTMEEDGDKFTYMPFVRFLSDYAEDHTDRLEWFHYYIEDFDYGDEHWDICSDLKWYVMNISLTMVSADLLADIGVEQKKYLEYYETAQQNVWGRIDDLCREQRKQNISFKADYFKLLNCQTDVIRMDLASTEERRFSNPMEKFLSYEDQTAFSIFRVLSRRIDELHDKIDVLTKAQSNSKPSKGK